MPKRHWSRRDVLKTSTASAAGAVFAEPVRAAAPPATSVTPELIEAARKEGKISYYSAQIRETPGRQPLSAIKLLKSDPAQVLAQSEDIKARYARLFKV